jgi:hypothetical protein
LQNYLGDLGFSAALRGLRRGPAAANQPFRRPALARAEEGLLHVMGVLRERDEVRTGFETGTRRLQHPLRPPGHPPGHLQGAIESGRPDGAAAFGAVELLEAKRRPKIGMVPSLRTDGLASA